MHDKTFIKSLLSGLIYAIGLILTGLLIRIFMGHTGFWNYASALISLICFLLVYAWQRSYKEKNEAKRNPMYKFFFYGIRVIIFITLLIGLWGIYVLMATSDCESCAVFQAIGLGLVVIWACIFLSYFIWAIYYYNLNPGLTEEDWDRIKKAKESKRTGDYYSEEDIAEEPVYNPYKDETFGLPPGTVRGMIAFTLLFGALAMLIVSIGMTREIDPNSLFYDQYDFFKTAFLMMIAFYFGTRSLQYLKSKKDDEPLQKASPKKAANKSIPLRPPAQIPVESVIDPMQKPADENNTDKSNKPAPAEDGNPVSKQEISHQLFDPMNP